jgi:hypothetical protein
MAARLSMGRLWRLKTYLGRVSRDIARKIIDRWRGSLSRSPWRAAS